jgi:V/A-type H+-transporting ATPase subunit D
VSASAAVPLAAEAYRAALVAGVEHAVAAAAARVVAAEVTVTGGRLRAIEDRWVPELEAALHALELSLDELERGDGVRLRWAAGRRGEAR